MLSFSLHLVWGLLILREFLPGGHFLLHIIGALMCCKRSRSGFFPNLWWWRIFERVWKQWDVVGATRITKQPRKLLPQGEDLCHCCVSSHRLNVRHLRRWATTLHGTSSSQQLRAQPQHWRWPSTQGMTQFLLDNLSCETSYFHLTLIM